MLGQRRMPPAADRGEGLCQSVWQLPLRHEKVQEDADGAGRRVGPNATPSSSIGDKELGYALCRESAPLDLVVPVAHLCE
jgi:hypothetical protein